MAKDEKNLAAVEKIGSDFVPLVVECFGVWTPFALKTLKIIADHTTPQSVITPKLTKRASSNNFLFPCGEVMQR